jgi:hypothetical protein
MSLHLPKSLIFKPEESLEIEALARVICSGHEDDPLGRKLKNYKKAIFWAIKVALATDADKARAAIDQMDNIADQMVEAHSEQKELNIIVERKAQPPRRRDRYGRVDD